MKRRLRRRRDQEMGPSRQGDVGRSAMADRDIIIGRIINVTGMIGVSAGIILFTFAIVLLLFRRGFGFDIANSLAWFW
jgi:hypothetical protein